MDSTDHHETNNTADQAGDAVAFDREAARQHCLLLARGNPDERFVFQAFADRPEDKGNPSLVGTRYGTFDEVAGWVEEMNANKAGVFVTVNRTSGAGRSDGDIVGVRSFFYDWDEKDGLMKAASPLPGSLIVRSGHGCHCYYLLDKVASPGVFTVIQTAIAAKLGTDAKVTDRPRVMRLAGSVNWKAEPIRVVIVEAHPERTYTIEQVATAFGVDPASLGSGSSPRRERPAITVEPTADHKAIRAGCAWFDGLFKNPEDADEQHWFAGLRVVVHCANAETVAHEMSSGHKDYTAAETTAKLARARGYEPLSCRSIRDQLGFVGCDTCAYQWRRRSPLDLGRTANNTSTSDDGVTPTSTATDLDIAEAAVAALEAGRADEFNRGTTYQALASLGEDDRERLLMRIRAYLNTNGRRLGFSRKNFDDRMNATLRERLRAQQRSSTGLPIIVLSNAQLRNTGDQAMAALVTANDGTPIDFVRGLSLVRVVKAADDGTPVVQEHTIATMRGRLTRVADFLRDNGRGGFIGCSPAKDVIEEVLHRAEFVDLPILAGVTTAPIARDDGSFSTTPGYDRDTGLYLVGSDELVEYNIPAVPTPEDVQQAVAALRFVFCDFPLVGEAGFAHIVALLLTLLLRARFRDACPMFLIRATSPGTGKTLLLEVCVLIVLGLAHVDTLPPADNDEEMRKRLSTAILEGRPVIAIDNLDGRITSHVLASFITTPMWNDRRLGVNASIRAPNRATTIINGNNTTCSDDLLRRLVLILMHYAGENPAARTGFQVPDLLVWVRAHRHELLAALLTLVRHWHASGKPVPSDLTPFGSFEVWNQTISGILHSAGITGFRTDANLMADVNDGLKAQWAGFLRAIFLWSWGDPFTIADLADQFPDARGGTPIRPFPLLVETLPTELAARKDRGPGTLNHALGNACKAMANMAIAGFAVEQAGNDPSSHVCRWRVTCTKDEHLPPATRSALRLLDLLAESGWWTNRPERRPRLDRQLFRTALHGTAQASGLNAEPAMPDRADPAFRDRLVAWVSLFITSVASEPAADLPQRIDATVAAIMALPPQVRP